MISAGGGCEFAAITRARTAWGKYRDLLPILSSKSVALKTKGRVYDTCVRSAMLYGSDTWASRKTGLARLQRNEGSMLRCVCGVGPEDRVGGAVMCGRLGMSELGDSMNQGCLCWCGHVTGGCDWIAQCHGIGFRIFKEREM